MATICSCNNTTAASTPTSTPSSLVSSTCGTNCHQTQWGLHRSICSRTDSPPSRCVKPLYWTMFYQHFTMHCFYQFLLMSSILTRILSLAHLFYAYFTHGPNKSASAQYDNTRGAWLTQEGCTITEREEGRSAVAQLVECRTRNRESPGSNPRCYRFEVWAFSFTSRRLSRLSCINEYLAIDSGEMRVNSRCAIAAWLECFQEKPRTVSE